MALSEKSSSNFEKSPILRRCHMKSFMITRRTNEGIRKKQSKDKHRSKDHGRNPLTDGEYMRKERQAAQECQDKDEFIALLQRMDTEKVHAMRSQEQLRVQMQIFNKAGNVEEGRRMEQLLNKTISLRLH